MSRSLPVMAGAAAVAALLLWLLPVLGLIAVVAVLVTVPPWGRSLAERAIISAVVLLGAVAIAFPRDGGLPISATTGRLVLVALMVLALALRLVPRLRAVAVPRPDLSDGLVALLAVGASWWLVSSYIGVSTEQVLSILFFSGWDNHGHFTTFANAYEVGSTAWPTIDGSQAWNQWYPSLHTTLWALLQHAVGPATLSRPDLLLPFAVWNGITFGLSLAAMAWVAGDVAARLLDSRWARPLAVAGFAVFALLGSPAFLFNRGFTNFVVAVALTVVVAWLSARSRTSARTLGWFLIPLAVVAVMDLWTPLVLGLVPSGIVVAVVLLRHRVWLGVAWLAATAVGGALLAVTQSQAILGAEGASSATDFATDLGEAALGMAPFNLAAAMVSPFIIALLVVILLRQRRGPMAMAVMGPVLGAAIIAVVFVFAADAAEVGRLNSYYVLKSLDAMLLATSPVIAALAAVVVLRAVAGLPRLTAVLGVAMAGLVLLGSFDYVGGMNGSLGAGFQSAPGIQAGIDRSQGVSDPLIGSAILGGVEAARDYPERTTVLWDGSGQLPNLWVASLHGVLSKKQTAFYAGLPTFPYDDKALQYLTLALNLDGNLRVVALWFRPSSGEALEAYVLKRGDDRVVLSKVTVPPGPLCPECAS